MKNIEDICSKYKIRNYSINSDGSIDVSGNVYLCDINLTKLPLKFRRVTGYFNCSVNKLTSLKGAPEWVGSSFNCSENKLTTLEGCPEWVGNNFSCQNNKLTTLKGSPKGVFGSFECSDNKLTNLEGCSEEVGGYFVCSNNQLTTLRGCPKWVGGSFYCGDNKLWTFEYLPNIKDDLYNDLYCSGNPIWTIWDLFRSSDFLDKIKYKYTDYMSLIKEKDGQYYIESDIMEEIAEELNKKLPIDWKELFYKRGYRVI